MVIICIVKITASLFSRYALRNARLNNGNITINVMTVYVYAKISKFDLSFDDRREAAVMPAFIETESGYRYVNRDVLR